MKNKTLTAPKPIDTSMRPQWNQKFGIIKPELGEPKCTKYYGLQDGIIDKKNQSAVKYEENKAYGYTGFAPSRDIHAKDVKPSLKENMQTDGAIPGYTGHMKHVKAQNIFGRSFGKT